jgi:hypothetical protein
MSRAYRIQVKETLKRTLKGEDRITTQLELLEVLPADQMADLLKHELEKRGFKERPDGLLERKDGDVTVTVDVNTGTVTVQAEASEDIELQGHREGVSYDDVGPNSKSVKQNLQKELQKDLEKRAEQRATELQGKATEKLEGHLNELQKELSQAVNRVTAEALKQKAAQLGQIKELSEDPESGSLTITVEV